MSSSVSFTIKNEDWGKIQDKINKFPGNAEKTINAYLKNTGSRIANDSIVNLVPVSEKGKYHAKEHNPLDALLPNLGFSLTTKPKFYYLTYVIEGTSTSTKYGERPFMQQGMDAQYENIIGGIMESLEKEITL